MSRTQKMPVKTHKDRPGRDVWKRFRKNKTAVAGLIVILLIAVVAACADWFVPYDRAIANDMDNRLQSPSAAHPLGTDEFGRDEYARILHGARRSLSLGVATTVFSITIGCFLAAICGYYGGLFDAVIMRICDVFTCIPTFLFALSVVAALGASLVNLLIAITVASLPYYIRMVRSVILGITEDDFIEAAHAAGSSDMFIIFRHILPNAMGPIIVEASMSVADMLLTAAGLSFIGMGIQPPTPEWGAMLSTARDYMRAHPHLLLSPGISIGLSALSLNLVGDGLRDAIDPRLKE